MTERVVVKNNWVDSMNDQISEFFGTCAGYFVLGGVLVTGWGCLAGFTETPKGQDPAPQMVEQTIKAHTETWKAIGGAIGYTIEAIQDTRPEA